MAKGLFRRFGNGNNRMWWITAFAVLGFFLCVGAVVYIRFFASAQSGPLPEVPTFTFNTSTPGAGIAPIAPQPTNIFVTSIPVLASPIPPTSTATSFSLFGWISGINPNRSQGTTAVPPTITRATPIQVVIPRITATQTPSLQPTQSPTLQPTQPPITFPNTCKNILYPARPGSQWTYFVNSTKRNGDVNMRVVSVDGQLATVDAFESSTGSSVRTFVQCDQDVILNFPLLSGQKLLGSMIDGAMTMDYIGGVLAPNEAAFVSSNYALSWIIQYRVAGSGFIDFRGREFFVEITPSTVQMTCQTLASGSAAFESVTVFAGTFNALKVVCRGEGQVTATVNGSQVTGTITAQATQWFAPNIGLLRSQSDYANLNVFGISIPLNPNDLSGTMELRSYTIGQ